MPPLKILITGASIAGPTTAYFLSKLPSDSGSRADITIIERSPHLRPGGQAIDIRTCGVTVMREIPGLEALIRAKSTAEEGMSFVREDGRPYGVIRATGNADRQSLISEFEILRGELAGILVGLTRVEEEGGGNGVGKNGRGNVRYLFGEEVAAIRENGEEDGPVTVEFKNGRLETQEFDLVVACDGATSRTRAMGFGCGVREYIVPTNTWTAYFSIKQDLLNGSKIGQGLSAVGGRSISLGSDLETGGSRVMLMNCQPRGKDGDAAVLPFREALKEGEETLKRYITKHYEGVGWKSDFCLQEMMDAPDFYASEIVQVKVPHLYKGRFVLVGDAGYAAGLTGGGTSLALAGAYLLAGEIGKHPGNLAAGLKGYEEKMRPLIAEMQKIPPFVTTVMAPQTEWGIWIRNHVFALIAWTGVAEFLQRWLGGAFASTEAFPLPVYEWIDDV